MEQQLVVEVLKQYLKTANSSIKLRIRLYMALRTAILERTLSEERACRPPGSWRANYRLAATPWCGSMSNCWSRAICSAASAMAPMFPTSGTARRNRQRRNG